MKLSEQLQQLFRNDADFIIQPTWLAGIPIQLAGYKSLIDIPQTLMLLHSQAGKISLSNEMFPSLLNGLGYQLTGCDEAVTELLKGRLIVIYEPAGIIVSAIPVSKTLTRAIEAPTTENVLRGSISAFQEDIDKNIGMLRRHVFSEQLQVKSYSIGKSQPNRLEVVYLENRINSNLLNKIVQRIETQLDMDIQNLQQLDKMLGFSKWTLVTKLNTTELPQYAASALQNGKAVLLFERFPFGIILPSLLWDMFSAHDDLNFPYIYMVLTRFLRIIGALVTIMFPGLYVALVSVNPDVLRIELALSIARSRIDVPYPAFVETLLLLLVLELTLEASLRLPKSIGPTITMVGGIILGQAVVAAKLVSNLLIIILAGTTIATSTVVGFQNSLVLRLFKYLILMLSAIYGVLGLASGIVVMVAYMASVTSFGVPYLYMTKAKDKPNG
ncbi:spore germination protein [Paenibacillus thalictri]|uniref:Spore gernimation protein GerA n=1 Tax=Paenibacillus thalictri TaxID=2527873 RepID=A0A4Q9DNY0_9BACL|nr:spore germination protein [Paenibacillus thalictri]TBL74611.1 spore gernimation protein GerA [Paenibacillus thalictri]